MIRIRHNQRAAGWPLAAAMGLLASCANIVAPTGGPKDTRPPGVVATEPGNGSPGFTGNTIRIQFDEYIQIKDESRQVLLSPPTDEPPAFRIKGRNLLIELPGKLKENTTYCLNFGNALQDFTEGNPLSDFRFVFATGNTVDSLRLDGLVLTADQLSPAAAVMVFLYPEGHDTLVFSQKPRYVSRTAENGQFSFSHLAPGKYRIMAVKDANNDYLVTLPVEEIAFSDSLVSPWYKPAAPDTSGPDSLLTLPEKVPVPVRLLLSKQQDTVQRLLKAVMPKAGHILIPFSRPVTGFFMKPVRGSAEIQEDWCLTEWSERQDTLHCWLKPDIGKDSLYLAVSADPGIRDTLGFNLKHAGKRGKGKEEDPGKPVRASFTYNIKGTALPDMPLVITSAYPLVKTDLSACLLVTPDDTLKVSPEISGTPGKNLILRYPWKENGAYRFIIPDSTLTNLQGQTNDSLVIQFSTRPLMEYGKLTLNLKTSKTGPFILQLLKDQEKPALQTLLEQPGTWNIPHLAPGKYRVKIIRDINNNSRWDSGNYHKRIQPEPVDFYPDPIEIRGNWEVEETWNW